MPLPPTHRYARSRVPGVLLPAIVLACAVASCGPDPVTFDLVLQGGTVVDGTGSPGVRADVGVLEGRIAAVGDLGGRGARERVDVSGLVVAPGFVDPHVHARGSILEIPTADNFVLQGVTTLVDGNDGGSPLPVGAFLDSLEVHKTAVNFALLVGHGTVRSEVIGTEDRDPTPAELASMEALVAAAMVDGALGLSTGLFYVPGAFAETEELAALARVAARYGGIYTSHMRNEDVHVLESVRETIRIGLEAGLPVHISHHKMGGRAQFGLSTASLEVMREAEAQGVEVTFDQYPYTASSTGLGSIIPTWARAGGRLQERLGDAGLRRRIVDEIQAFVAMRFGDDASKIQLSICSFDEQLAGRTLADILTARGTLASPDAISGLILELDAAGGCGAIFHSFDEGDVELLMQSPFGMIGSDGGLVHFGEASPHPRAYGTFPRVLGRYVRERGVLSLEEAVRRMTSAPADRLGFQDLGRIEVGKFADIVAFDPTTVADRATFQAPHQFPVGIPLVLVGGVVVVRDGQVTGTLPGRVLRGPGYGR